MLEVDVLDLFSVYVLVCDSGGQLIGVGWLILDGCVGCMVVLVGWCGCGVGEVVLLVLVVVVWVRGWCEIVLYVQLLVCVFYVCQGFLLDGDLFEEVGIVYQYMCCVLDGVVIIIIFDEVVVIIIVLVYCVWCYLWIYSCQFDLGLFDVVLVMVVLC